MLVHKDAMEVAMRGSTAAITEYLATLSADEQQRRTDSVKQLLTGIESVSSTLQETAADITSEIRSAASSISSAVSSAVRAGSNLAGIGSQIGGSGSSGSSGSSGGKRYPGHWYTEDGETVDFATVVKDTGSVANAFKELGYEKNENGHWTKPKGSARGSLITQDALYRAGELGLNEAIIPLERPDVLSKVGAAIGAEVSGIGSQDTGSSVTYILFTDEAVAQLDSLLAARLLNNKDAMEIAIRGAVSAITEALHTMSDSANSKQDDMLAKITALSKEQLEAASQNASEIISAIDSAADSISSAVGNIKLGSNLGFGFGGGIGRASGGGRSGGTRYPDHWYTEDGETVDFATVVKDTGAVANAFKELGYEKNENGHWTKPKGSARGSLVTKDALYRAGELGLNEAIIPLERPDILAKVGSAIGSSVPSPEAEEQSSAT